MKVLVTGAAGRLGPWVVRELDAAGHDVRATDRAPREEIGYDVKPADLLDAEDVRRIMDGIEAVVHLGNHSGATVLPDPRRIFDENMRMNMNVFGAAETAAVGTVIFASTVQVLGSHPENRLRELPVPPLTLPLDGCATAAPRNFYALSKTLGERVLGYLSLGERIRGVAARFPSIVSLETLDRMRFRPSPSHGLIREALAYITFSDAASFVRAALEHAHPGYTCYQPASHGNACGLSAREAVNAYLTDATLSVPQDELDALIDMARLLDDLSWRPSEG